MRDTANPAVRAKRPPVVIGSTTGVCVSRLKAAGEKFRESDHGYCNSVYASSPDGLIVEFTVDPPDVAEIDAARRIDAHSELARWLAGDRHTNNTLRHRDF